MGRAAPTPMRLELTGRHIRITPSIRRLIEQRLSPMMRLLNDSAVSAQVVLTKLKLLVQAEVTLHARGEHFLHGEATGRDVDAALKAAADKVDRQAQKLKSRWAKGKRQGLSAAKAATAVPRPARRSVGDGQAGSGPRGRRVVRARRYAVKPMSVDEAALEVVDTADAFLVFRNAKTDTINVLFRRADGNLGLIEPEA